MTHTAEPWSLGTEDGGYALINAKRWDGIALVVVQMNGHDKLCPEGVANARRIVAAVNACAGISTEDLECNRSVFIALLQERLTFKQQRDDLLAACKRALYALKGREHDGFLRDAIARAEGREVQG